MIGGHVISDRTLDQQLHAASPIANSSLLVTNKTHPTPHPLPERLSPRAYLGLSLSLPSNPPNRPTHFVLVPAQPPHVLQKVHRTQIRCPSHNAPPQLPPPLLTPPPPQTHTPIIHTWSWYQPSSFKCSRNSTGLNTSQLLHTTRCFDNIRGGRATSACCCSAADGTPPPPPCICCCCCMATTSCASVTADTSNWGCHCRAAKGFQGCDVLPAAVQLTVLQSQFPSCGEVLVSGCWVLLRRRRLLPLLPSTP